MRGQIALQPAVTKAASFTGNETNLGDLKDYRGLVITLDVTAAERDTLDETYDVYVTCGDGTAKWDIVHFPQIATTGAKRFTAFVRWDAAAISQTVSTAVPGVAANDPGTFATITAGANEGIKTLGAGLVRNGTPGMYLGHELVVAGTVATGISYSIKVTRY